MATAEIPFPALRERGWLDRALSLLSRVEGGEGAGTLLLAANVFILLAAYYILKTVREALILAESGAEVKSYASAGQALLLLLVVPAYGIFASRVNRMRLIGWVTAFFISHLGLFVLLGQAGTKVGIAFYLWLGIFNNLVVAQFWSFANDIYSEEQGKRLFPIVGIGMSLGAWVGSQMASRIFRVMGPYQLMVLSALMLAASIGLTWMVHRRESRRAVGKKAEEAAKPLAKEGGFQLVMRNRYLRLIAILILLLNVVNTTGEFLLGKLVVEEANRVVGTAAELGAQRGAFIGEFYGQFFSWVNLLGFLIQTFLVSRIFRYIGVRKALFILPLIALGGYGLLVTAPVLAIVRVAKILENSTDYSLQNTIRHALFLPTSREAKYKAKAAIDTFFVRAGDMLQAGIVYLGTAAGFVVANFAVMNLLFVGVWLAVAAAIFREHKKLTSQQ